MTMNDQNDSQPKLPHGGGVDPRQIRVPRVYPAGEHPDPTTSAESVTELPSNPIEVSPPGHAREPLTPLSSSTKVGQPTSPSFSGNVQPSEQTKALLPQNPLRRHSVFGRADELEAKATETTPLLGDFIMKGQATMIYAAPNTGKTLILLHLVLEAIEQGRIGADRVFYVNADDSSKGLAVKARLLQDVGAHMLVPGL